MTVPHRSGDVFLIKLILFWVITRIGPNLQHSTEHVQVTVQLKQIHIGWLSTSMVEFHVYISWTDTKQIGLIKLNSQNNITSAYKFKYNIIWNQLMTVN